MKMRRITALFLILASIICLSACNGAPQENKPTVPVTHSPMDSDGIYDVGLEKLPFTEKQLYLQLFDPNNKIEVDLDMPEEELLKIQEDYDHYRDIGSKSPIFRKGSVVISITVEGNTYRYRIQEVGVRMKGNTSRTDFYNTNDGIYNNIHLRLDFQETFDEAAYYGNDCNSWATEELRQQRKDRTFATLEKLELRWNKCYDATYLRESYAYDLYRSEGVVAPYSNLSTFTWNEKSMGIYLLVEPVDKVFIENHLPEKDWDGDLYKCGWVYMPCSFTSQQSIGIENEDNSEFYTYDLKTNKKTSQHEALKALLSALNSGSMDKQRFEQYVDLDQFLSYAAVSYFLGNPDDLRNNYNNCYIYFLKSTGKVIIIPYDYDRCLGVTVEYNPSGHAMTKDNPFGDYCEGLANGREPQDSPLFNYSVVKGGLYVREFAQVLERVAANELLKPETFEARFNTAKALYGQDVTPERTLYNSDGRDFSFDLTRTDSASGGSNMSFKDYIEAKLSSYRGYAANVDEYAEYVQPVPTTFYIRGDFNDWSNQDRYGMQMVDGKAVYTLTMNRQFSFKVYNDITQEWFGTDFFPEEVALTFDTNRHANVILNPGTYYIEFDPENLILYVTEKTE